MNQSLRDAFGEFGRAVKSRLDEQESRLKALEDQRGSDQREQKQDPAGDDSQETPKKRGRPRKNEKQEGGEGAE